VLNNSIITTGSNTDGCDPDSSWNVYIARNHFSTGDDCIAIKAGRDWSGRMVNISTRNVLAEENFFGASPYSPSGRRCGARWRPPLWRWQPLRWTAPCR
jgi:polygalacturonase